MRHNQKVLFMNSIQAKEKFAECLMRPDVNAKYTSTILYIVYRTIEANENITLNQLRWTLGAEYLLKDEVIEGAVASLTSKSIFGCVRRYQPPRNKLRSVNGCQPVHLRAIPLTECDFKKWLTELLNTTPELGVFVPPTFVQRVPAAQQAANQPQRMAKEA